jgi:hypothetical protein
MKEEGHSGKIVKKGEKRKRSDNMQLPNLSLSLVELNGIEPSAS